MNWRSSKSGKRLLSRVETSAAVAAKQCAQAAAQLYKLRHAGAELRVRAHFGWRMVQEAVVTELKPLGASWFAPSQPKRPKKVSAPVAAASVSPEDRVRQLTAELRAERARSDDLRVQFETLQREHTRALRRAQGETDTEGIDELNAERARSDQLRIQLETLQREHTRALRREASAQGEADTEGQWAALQVLQLRAGTQR